MACTNYVEKQTFFTAESFTLQYIIIILQSSANEILVYFNIPWFYTIDNIGAKPTVIKTLGNKELWVTVMLIADIQYWTIIMLYWFKELHKAQLPMGLIIICQTGGWLTQELTTSYLKQENRCIVEKTMNACAVCIRGHLIQNVKCVSHAMNTDIMVIPGGMTLYTQAVLDFRTHSDNSFFQIL
jgi:hypothetical protein